MNLFYMFCFSSNSPLLFISVLLKKQLNNDRRTNLIPAKLGVYSLAIFFVFAVVMVPTYSLPFLNSESKALVIAILNDAYYCLISPAFVFYGSPPVRKTLKSYFM